MRMNTRCTPRALAPCPFTAFSAAPVAPPGQEF